MRLSILFCGFAHDKKTGAPRPEKTTGAPLAQQPRPNGCGSDFDMRSRQDSAQRILQNLRTIQTTCLCHRGHPCRQGYVFAHGSRIRHSAIQRRIHIYQRARSARFKRNGFRRPRHRQRNAIVFQRAKIHGCRIADIIQRFGKRAACCHTAGQIRYPGNISAVFFQRNRCSINKTHANFLLIIKSCR